MALCLQCAQMSEIEKNANWTRATHYLGGFCSTHWFLTVVQNPSAMAKWHADLYMYSMKVSLQTDAH